MLLERPLHLTHGTGNGVDTACLMTASNMLIGQPTALDGATCQCEGLREFIMETNDAIRPLGLLNRLYGPLAWKIIGTRTRDPDVIFARICRFTDWAAILLSKNLTQRFPGYVPPPLPVENIRNKADAVRITQWARTACLRLFRGNRPLLARTYYVRLQQCTESIEGFHPKGNRLSIGESIIESLGNVGHKTGILLGDFAKRFPIGSDDSFTAWSLGPKIIEEIAAIGDRRPVEPVLTPDQLAAALSGGTDA